MNHADSKISEYYGLNPASYSFLQSLALTQGISSSGVCEQSLSLILTRDIHASERRLRMTFRGTRNFRFQQPEWSMVSISHLEIVRNPTPGIGSVYMVRDNDQECALWFECNDYEATID
jgi:hypothetical protein